MKKFLQLSAAAIFLVALAGQSLAAPIGRVTAMVPGAFVQRGGADAALNLKDDIDAADTLSTDASGRVEILFADNSSVTLGPNTTMAMQEFAFDEGEPAFKAHLGQGLMRVITGAIVEQNPKGFSVTTPEAHIGIRGTIITILTRNGFTTVWVENTTRQVFVNNTEVPSGQKITVPSVPPLIEIITPQDREFIREGTATQAARDEGRQQGSARGPGGTLAWNYPPTYLADVPLAGQTQGDSLSTTPGAGGGGITPVTPPALFSGTMSSTPGFMISNSFSFEMNLSTGAISNASISGDQGGGVFYNASGGVGSMAANGAFNITGFGGTAWSGGIPFAILPSSTINSPGGGSVPAVGGSLGGNYQVDATTWTPVDFGAVFGTRTR